MILQRCDNNFVFYMQVFNNIKNMSQYLSELDLKIKIV